MDTAATLITVAYILKQGNLKKLRKKNLDIKNGFQVLCLYRGIFQILYYISMFIYMTVQPWLPYPGLIIKFRKLHKLFYISGEINKVSLFRTIRNSSDKLE